MHGLIIALISGLVFGAGLVLSDMVNPVKVQDFLDPWGSWDPSLAYVLGGALAVTLCASHFIMQRKTPLLTDRFHLTVNTRIDGRLILGAGIFGVGWGLSGYCPGPGLISAIMHPNEAILFLPALVIGGWIGGRFMT